ncbi:MAG: hypothetical protein C4294_12335 [Nitrospiraceae bacterium]
MARKKKKETEDKEEEVRDADDVIRNYYEGNLSPEPEEPRRNVLEDVTRLTGTKRLIEKLREHTAESPQLSADDIDASWEEADVGEEVVGGSNPTPDQDIVEEVGEAVGMTYQDTEPLRPSEKLEKRDTERWELNPASSEDYEERQEESGKKQK